MTRSAVLRRAGAFETGKITRRLNDCHVQTVADAEEGHFALARKLDRAHLALRAALTESARDKDAIDVLEKARRIVAFEDFAVDPLHVDADVVREPAMRQRLGQGLV